MPQFDIALSFDRDSGLAPVNVDEKWGYINTKGRLAINPEFENARPFFRGRAAVFRNSKWGYIDKKGQVVIPLSFTLADDFHDDAVHVVDGTRSFFIDKSGRRFGTVVFTSVKDGVLPGYPKSAHVENSSPYYTLIINVSGTRRDDGRHELKPGASETYSPSGDASVAVTVVGYKDLKVGGIISLKEEHTFYPTCSYYRYWLMRTWLIENRTEFSIEGVLTNSKKDWGFDWRADPKCTMEVMAVADRSPDYTIPCVDVWKKEPGYKYIAEEYRVSDGYNGKAEITRIKKIPMPIDEVRLEIYGGNCGQIMGPISLPYIAVRIEDVQTGSAETWSVWGGHNRSRHVYQKIGYKGIKGSYFMVEDDDNREFPVHRIKGARENYIVYPQQDPD